MCVVLHSGESGDGLIDHGKSISTVFEVDTLPLIVEVVHVVDVTVDDWRHHVDEEEHWDGGENQTDEVARKTDINLTISLERAEGFPQSAVVGRRGERSLLFAEAWNVKVDACAHLSLDLIALNHLHDLALLLVRDRVVGAVLAEILSEVVLHLQ